MAFVPVRPIPLALTLMDWIVRLTLHRFDWFFKSRTPEELKRRGQTLLLVIMKDKDPEDDKKAKPAASKVSQRTVQDVVRAVTDIFMQKRPIDDLKNGTASRDTTPGATAKPSMYQSQSPF